MARPFVPVANVARVEMIFSQQGKNVENVYHVWKFPPAMSDPDLGTVGNLFVNWYNTQLRTMQPATIALQKVVLTTLTTQTSPGLEYTSGLPIAGENGSLEAPANVTAVIRLNTALRGRSYRGRIYHVGLVPGQILASRLTDATVVVILGVYTNLHAQLQAAGYDLVVVSYVSNKTRRLNGVTTPVLNISTDGAIDTQRRRLPDG